MVFQTKSSPVGFVAAAAAFCNSSIVIPSDFSMIDKSLDAVNPIADRIFPKYCTSAVS